MKSKQLVDELNLAFSEHKVKNDQRLLDHEKNGRVDPLLEQQVNRISSEIQGTHRCQTGVGKSSDPAQPTRVRI